jgi:chaperonin cofactor prefoldin
MERSGADVERFAARFIVALVGLSVILAQSRGLAQAGEKKEQEKEKVSVVDLVKPLLPITKETESTRVFLKMSLARYKELDEKLKKTEQEAQAALQKATTDAEKLEIAEAQLKKRLELLDQVTQEISFVNEKMNGVVKQIGTLIGGVKASASAAEKLAANAKEVDRLIENTEKLQREYTLLKSKQPDADTDEYWDWYEKVRTQQRAFCDALNKLDELVQDEFVYSRVAEGLHMKKQDAVQWRIFTADLSFRFSVNESKLKSASKRTKQYLEYIEGTRALGDADEFAKFLAEIEPLMKNLGDLALPTVGPLTLTQKAPPIPPLPGADEIGTTNIRERVANQRKMQKEGKKNQ